jgi:hypothetical protein
MAFCKLAFSLLMFYGSDGRSGGASGAKVLYSSGLFHRSLTAKFGVSGLQQPIGNRNESDRQPRV